MHFMRGGIVALSLLLAFAAVALAQDPGKAKKCAAGWKKCMADCDRQATASTGNTSHPNRIQMCRSTYCDPAMVKNNCPAQP
jgi:hypothetical protein